MFYSAFYSAMSSRHDAGVKNYIEEIAAQKYFTYSNDNKSKYIKTIGQDKTDFSDNVFVQVLKILEQMVDLNKKFFEIGQMVDYNLDILKPYSVSLKAAVVSGLESRRKLSSENIVAMYVILLEMENKAIITITADDISNILTQLIDSLYEEHPDLIISSKDRKAIKELYHKYCEVHNNNTDDMLKIKIQVLFSIYELNKNIHSKNVDEYNAGLKKYQVDISKLELNLKNSYIEKVADLSLAYWENTGSYPKLNNLLYITDVMHIREIYIIVFEKMILNIIENKSEKDICEWIVKVIELSLISNIMDIEKQLAEYLLHQPVKITDITKLMEKDWEILKKNKTKQISQLLSKVDENYLMDTIVYINNLASDGKSKLSSKLQQLSVKNLFGKKGR